MTKRSLTPSVPPSPSIELRSQRRSTGGARTSASEPVLLSRSGQSLTGWALNASHGGLRMVAEELVVRGEDYAVIIGDESNPPRPARAIWVREEGGGCITGLQYLDVEGSLPPIDFPEDDE